MTAHRALSADVLWTGSVGELFRHPVKSMQGESVEQLTIGSGGVEGDRSFALLDRESGNVVSAHHPQKWGLLLHCSARWDGEPNLGGEIVVTLPDGSEERAGPHLEALLSELLGRRVGLIREAPDGGSYEYLHPDIEGVAPDSFIEQTLKSAGVRDGRVGRLRVALDAPRGSLVDVSPVHLIASPSRAALQAAGFEFDVRRFRPNLVLEGPGSGYLEDEWSGGQVALAEVVLNVSMPTPRCVVTTLEQRGIRPDNRILRELASANRIDLDDGRWACFGSFANVAHSGVVSRGDAVIVRRQAASN